VLLRDRQALHHLQAIHHIYLLLPEGIVGCHAQPRWCIRVCEWHVDEYV
jgi:hypothetical protein